jgi:alkylation response protein AidB-like acyl-CoA dehydrogenase
MTRPTPRRIRTGDTVSEEMFRLDGKVAIVAGAARGQGAAEASRDAGLDRGEAANTAKYLAAEASYYAADRAVQTLGKMGYAVEDPVERYWREAHLQRIAPVSQEMSLTYLAQSVLDLPSSY